jgi:hypothetical protein
VCEGAGPGECVKVRARVGGRGPTAHMRGLIWLLLASQSHMPHTWKPEGTLSAFNGSAKGRLAPFWVSVAAHWYMASANLPASEALQQTVARRTSGIAATTANTVRTWCGEVSAAALLLDAVHAAGQPHRLEHARRRTGSTLSRAYDGSFAVASCRCASESERATADALTLRAADRVLRSAGALLRCHGLQCLALLQHCIASDRYRHG